MSNITSMQDNHPVRVMRAHDTYELIRDIKALWPCLELKSYEKTHDNQFLKASVSARLRTILNGKLS